MFKFTRYFIILLLALLASSCTPVSIENNKRILIEGRIVGEDMQPLEGVNVRTSTYINRFLNRGIETLAEGTTNESGEISFVSLDVNPGMICLDIREFHGAENYQQIRICDSSSSRKANKFDLGDFQLRKQAIVTVVVSLDQNLGYTLSFEDDYTQYEIEDWNELSNFDNPDLVGEVSELSGVFNSENTRDTLRFRTLKNSSFALLIRYPVTQEIYEFDVNEEENIYEIDL